MQIAEVANRYGVSVDTIRYYERIGLIPHVTRRPNGIRDFTEYDCGWVARLDILVEQREKLAAKLEEMAATVKRLDGKIASYQKDGACSEIGDERLRRR